MSENKKELTEPLLGDGSEEQAGLRKTSSNTLIQLAEANIQDHHKLRKKKSLFTRDENDVIYDSDLMSLELEKYNNKLLELKKPEEEHPENKEGPIPEEKTGEKTGEKPEAKAGEKAEEKPNEKSKWKAKQDKFDNYVKSIHNKTKEFIETPIRIMDSSKINVLDNDNQQVSSKSQEIKSIALSPDQTRLLTGGDDSTLYIFDINDEKTITQSYVLSETVMTVAYSPKGNLILGGTNLGSLILFNLETEVEVPPRRSVGPKTVLKTVAFSPDGESLIVGCDDGKLKIFPLKGEENECFDILEHEGEICSYAYSNSIKKYATGGDDNILYLFKLSENLQKVEGDKITITAHKGSVRSLAFSNDGRYLLSGSYDKTAKLFESAGGKELMTYKGHSDPILAVAISPDSQYVLTGGRDYKAILFNRQTGEIVHTFDEYDEIRAVLFLGDGSKIITAGAEGLAKVYSLEKNHFFRGHSLHYTVADDNNAKINCIDVSFEFNKVVTGGNDSMVRLFDLETAFEIKKFGGNEGPVFTVKLSPDGKIVLSGGDDCILRLYDVYSGALACSFENHQGDIMSIIFSPDGEEFATGGEDKTINIYNFIKRELVISCSVDRKKKKKDLFIQCMSYSPNGKWIVFGGYDTVHNGGIGVYSRVENTKINLVENFNNLKEIIDLEFANDVTLVAISELKMYLIEFDDVNDLTKYKVVKSVDTSENFEFKTLAIQRKLNNFKIFTTSNNEENGIFSKIEIWDHELNMECIIYDTSNDEWDEITSKISFVKEDEIIFGSSLGIPKLMKIERDEQNKEKYLKLTENYFTQVVSILTIDNSGSKVALCTKAGNIRIINIFSGRLLNNNNEVYLKDLIQYYDTQEFKKSQNENKNEEEKVDNKEKEENKENEGDKEPEFNKDSIRISSLKFSYVSEILLIGMNDGTLLVYNYEMKQMINIISSKKKLPMMELEYYNDTEKFYIFSGLADGTILIKEIVHNKQYQININDPANPSEQKVIMMLCPFKYISSNKKTNKQTDVYILKMLVLYEDGSLECYEINEQGVGKPEIILDKLKEQILCASHSNDFSKIITGGEDNLVRIYDVSTKGERIFDGHEDKITSVSFLSDIRYAASASQDQIFKIFEIGSGNELFTHRFDVTLNKICVSRLMETIVCGTFYGLRLIYSVLTPKNKLENFYRIGNAFSDKKKNKNFELADELKPDSFDLLPIKLDLSLIHVKLAYSKNKIDVLKEVADLLTSNPDDAYGADCISKEKKEYLCECVFRKDAQFNLSPWKIWIREARNNKVIEQMVYEKLIDILLCPEMVHVEKMRGKSEFIEKIAQRCPGRLQEVLDVFWKSTDQLTIKMHRMSTLMKIKYYWNCLLGIFDIFECKKRYLQKLELPLVLHTKNSTPCTRIMERKFEKECSLYHTNEDPTDVTYFKSFVKISKISLDEIVNLDYFDQFKPDIKHKCAHSKFLLEMFTNFPPEHNLFKSELLKTVVNYLWGLQECIGFAFYRRLLLFFLFQLLIGMNCLHFIPERQASADLNNPNPPHESIKEYYQYASLISDSAIIFILGFLFIMRNVQIIN